MAKIDYGAVALIPVGDYSASRQYHANELVGYQGSSYIALQNPPVGTLPTNTTYFMLHTAGTSIATASTPGTVKPDGTSTVVDATGAMSVKPSLVQAIQDTAESAAESASKIGNVPTGKTLQAQIDGLEPRVSSSEQALTVNLLNPTLERKTVSGVTVTRNADNTYTLNGTATQKTDLIVKTFTATKSQNVRITGCPQGGAQSTFYIAAYNAPDATGIVRDFGYGTTKELSAGENYSFRIVIQPGTVCDNLVFKPMITTNLSATYDDYVPYSGSSGKLDTDYKALSAKIGNVGNTDLQSQVNAATQSIAQNTTDIAANAAGISALNTGLANISNAVQPIGTNNIFANDILVTASQINTWLDATNSLTLQPGTYVLVMYISVQAMPIQAHIYAEFSSFNDVPINIRYCEVLNSGQTARDSYGELTTIFSISSTVTIKPRIISTAALTAHVYMSAIRIR
jgi:hypothetical protein